MVKTLFRFVAQWMSVVILLTTVLAMLFSQPLKAVDTWWINPMIGVIMFGMGLTMSADDFHVLLRRPKDVVTGCVVQFAVMPLTAWLLTRLFRLPEDIALGVILVGCCPGGTASNVITYLAKGDIALSVGMTACSTLLAPFVTPLLVLTLAGATIHVDALGMVMSILYIVIAPIVAGLLAQRYLPRLTHRVVDYLPGFSTLMIAFVVALIVGHTAEKLMVGGVLVIVVVMLHNAIGLTLGYAIAAVLGMPRKKRVALSVEVGMQNSGLASSLAVLHFASYPMAAIPGAVFSVWHNISGAIVARWYARRVL